MRPHNGPGPAGPRAQGSVQCPCPWTQQSPLPASIFLNNDLTASPTIRYPAGSQMTPRLPRASGAGADGGKIKALELDQLALTCHVGSCSLDTSVSSAVKWNNHYYAGRLWSMKVVTCCLAYKACDSQRALTK
ncbi:hypothetical protein TREES_T100020444 [Tupaia chinensis]|uniref:Uncharacterized protein n=1 Tax=Tupaia chinensis TaxID=246437 RepID=L9KX70_TUPCH|nr:hypothetical protein TREES_T100020444 [Tupaia chinensis]